MIFLYDVPFFVDSSVELVDCNVLAHTPFKKLFKESKAINGDAGL